MSRRVTLAACLGGLVCGSVVGACVWIQYATLPVNEKPADDSCFASPTGTPVKMADKTVHSFLFIKQDPPSSGFVTIHCYGRHRAQIPAPPIPPGQQPQIKHDSNWSEQVQILSCGLPQGWVIGSKLEIKHEKTETEDTRWDAPVGEYDFLSFSNFSAPEPPGGLVTQTKFCVRTSCPQSGKCSG